MYYAILIYIIIIVFLVVVKPNFIYNHDDGKYREFGNNNENKTFFTLPVIAFLLSIIIVILFSTVKNKEQIKYQEQIKYIPYFQMPTTNNIMQ